MAPPTDLATALRVALPAHLQHVAEPLAHTLEAIADPDTGVAVSQALAQIAGRDLALTSGTLISFAGSNVDGPLTMRDTAGRDIINLNFNLAPSSGQRSAALDEEQLHILEALVARADGNGWLEIDYARFSAELRLLESELEEELETLAALNLIEIMPSQGGADVTLKAAGRKLLRRRRQEAYRELLGRYNIDDGHVALLLALSASPHGRLNMDRLPSELQLTTERFTIKTKTLHDRGLVKGMFVADGQAAVVIILPPGEELAEKFRRLGL